MHAMILDTLSDRLDLTQIAFLEAGIHVTGSGSLAVAETCLRRAVVDLLVIEHEGAGQRAGDIIAQAERRNPRLVTLMLTQDVAGASDAFTGTFASLHCVLDADVAPEMVTRMAQASLAGRALCRASACKPAPARPVPDRAAAPEPDLAETVEDRPVFSSSRRRPLVPHEALMAV